MREEARENIKYDSRGFERRWRIAKRPGNRNEVALQIQLFRWVWLVVDVARALCGVPITIASPSRCSVKTVAGASVC